MGQLEVYRFLEEKRDNSDKWYSAPEIKTNLEKKGLSNGTIKGHHSDLLKLASFGMIQARGVGLIKHYKEYRAFPKKGRK